MDTESIDSAASSSRIGGKRPSNSIKAPQSKLSDLGNKLDNDIEKKKVSGKYFNEATLHKLSCTYAYVHNTYV